MPSIFEKYDLKQVINTSGRMTALGVSTPRPEVVEAAMAGNGCLLRIGRDRPVGGWRIG